MGKVKRLELWWLLYRTWLPVRDLENFRPMDFCSTECTGKHLPCWIPQTELFSAIYHRHSVRILTSLTTKALHLWLGINPFNYTNTQAPRFFCSFVKRRLWGYDAFRTFHFLLLTAHLYRIFQKDLKDLNLVYFTY